MKRLSCRKGGGRLGVADGVAIVWAVGALTLGAADGQANVVQPEPHLAEKAGADWPMWRYDASRSAATPHVLPRELALHWTRELDAPRTAFRMDRASPPI